VLAQLAAPARMLAAILTSLGQTAAKSKLNINTRIITANLAGCPGVLYFQIDKMTYDGNIKRNGAI
jgi:hypothetical protein